MISPSGGNLVFLIGAPRSGTTLLSAILAKVPRICCPPEPWIALPVARMLLSLPGLQRDSSDAALAALAVRESLGDTVWRRLAAGFVVGAYDALLAQHPQAELLVDKTPRYYKIGALLAELLPDARFLLVSRDPLDVAASHRDRWGLDLRALATAEGLADASFDVFVAPRRMADLRDGLGPRAHWLRYEDFATDPEPTLARAFAFLGVRWSAAFLSYRRNNRGAERLRASSLGDREVWKRSRVDAGSVGRWRSILDPEEVDLVCRAVGRSGFERLGYTSPLPERDDPELRAWLDASLEASLAGPGGTPTSPGGELAMLRSHLVRAERGREQAEVVAAREAAARTEESAARARWETLCREAEGQRDAEVTARKREGEARERWETLCREAEAHRDAEVAARAREAEARERWEALCREAEAHRDAEVAARKREAEERERWEALCREAEAQRDVEVAARTREANARERWEALFREAEAHREAEAAARASESEAKERWEALCREAEAHRDAEAAARAREADAKERWERLCHEAEAQRDAEVAARACEADAKERWEALCREAEAQRDALAAWREHLQALWPWMEGSGTRERTGLPRISVVTPSFNQARWIAATIESVLAQKYPDFEHIVVDAGSTDGTSEILARYPHLRLVQEPDRGQAHAINKGMLLATGDIVAYLNSDDVYREGAFDAVAEAMRGPDAPRVVMGHCDYVDERSETVGHLRARLARYEDLLRYWGWDRWYCVPQQAVFWRRELLSETGLFDAGLQYTMDYEMWLRMAARAPFQVIDRTLAAFRLQSESKTLSSTYRMYLEERLSSRRYWPRAWRPARWSLELASLRHLGRKLLDVAEHEALANRLRRHPLRLLAMALRRWPPLALDPRCALTVASALAARTSLERPAARLHRGWLRLLWLARRGRS